ncbi:hypothetical protein E1176_03790, partial [Fulvivirga sp. RKSG066]|uniref:sensor histidine kinase n=1 Tax=Fulvivirga aurantia TaxID=2529383 RepID=UPI001CA3AC10
VPSLPIDYFIVSFVDPISLISILVIYMALAALLYLSKSWFYIEHIKSVNASMELHNLRLQINPHFLLNSLNSIYGLTLNKSNEASAAVLQLGDLLKHMLYQKEITVDIDEEVKQIKNYVALQKLRIKDSSRIEVKIKQESFNGQIIPFLLLTFVENAFKHSDIQNNDFGYITIEIDQTDHFYFNVENTYTPGKDKSEKSGIGLNNAKRRLDLIYPDKHDLQINDSNNFAIKLKLSV